MSFNWASFESLLNMLVPIIIGAFVPNGAVLAPLISSSMAATEAALGSGTGTAKKAAVLSDVTAAVTVLNTVKGATVLDPVVTAQQVGAGIDLTISTINTIKQLQGKSPVAS